MSSARCASPKCQEPFRGSRLPFFAKALIVRVGDGCPRCGSHKIVRYGYTEHRRRRLKCKDCGKLF
ncbi:transposase-like zinc-binding domain-containing protein [Planktothrix agardhii]|uniref:transposase-like zinc-binding domain-containing protein n=1 Tax=Planktothrix agardhii TaxID=1160 RepID=UPI00406C8F11